MALPIVLPMLGVNLGSDGASLISGIGDQLFQAVGAALILFARVKDGSGLTATPS
jgi:hypothetical protein